MNSCYHWEMGRRESRRCFCYWIKQSSDLSKNPWRVDLVISLLSDSAGSSVAEVSLFHLFFSQAISSFLHSFIRAIILSFTHFCNSFIHPFTHSASETSEHSTVPTTGSIQRRCGQEGRQGQREREGHRAMIHS